MNFIPTWLRPFNFHTDPYSCPQAENLPEEIIKSLFVFRVFEPRFLDPELNILNYPASTVIHGWGKTMGLRWLIWWAKQSREVEGGKVFPLVVPYNHFHTLLMQNPPYSPQHHAAPLMSAFAMAFLMMLNEVGFVFLNQPAGYRENWWAFLNQYLPTGMEQMANWNSEDMPERMWNEMQSFRGRRLALDGELDQSLLVLTSWLRELGINRVYVGIDNLTGYGQTKDDGQAARLVAPLIETDQLFHIQGLYWKIFVSDAMRDGLASVPENRSLRYKVFPIQWTEPSLLDMLNRTLKECADPSLNDLNDLADRFVGRRELPLANELAGLAMRYPGSPPQNMLMFINELLQRAEMDASGRITEEIALGYLDEIKQAIMPPAVVAPVEQEEPAPAQEITIQEKTQEIEPPGTGEPVEQEPTAPEPEQEIADQEKTQEVEPSGAGGPVVQEPLAPEPDQAAAFDDLARELDELESQHEQHDYAHYVLDCSAQMRKIQLFHNKVIQSLQKAIALQKPSDESEEAQLLRRKITSLEEMARRTQTLANETETVCGILDAFPQENRDWAARALYTVDQEYIEDVKTVIAASDLLPSEVVMPLVEAVRQVRLTPPQANNRRGQLVEEGRKANMQPESRFRARLKISVLIVPLLFSLAVGPVFDDPLRENWQNVVRLARQIVK